MSLRLIVLLVPATLLQAQPLQQEQVRDAVESGRLLPLATLLARVQEQHPGRILEVELEQDAAGRPRYEIELATAPGQVRTLHVDPATGRILLDDAALSKPLRPLDALLDTLLQSNPGRVAGVDLRDTTFVVDLETRGGPRRQFLIDALDGTWRPVDAIGSRDGELQPLPAILRQLARSHPGTIVEVELERGADGRLEYEVDVRDDEGRLSEWHVDAVTGALRVREGS